MPEETFSDSDASFEPAKTVPRKRKSTGGTSTTKKTKKTVGSSSDSTGILNKLHSQLASTVLDNGVEFYADEDNQADAADAVVKLAGYVMELETALADAKSSGGVRAAKPKTRAELEAAADKIGRAAVSGIRKQMSVSAILGVSAVSLIVFL